jgi:hypothetical protein
MTKSHNHTVLEYVAVAMALLIAIGPLVPFATQA